VPEDPRYGAGVASESQQGARRWCWTLAEHDSLDGFVVATFGAAAGVDPASTAGKREEEKNDTQIEQLGVSLETGLDYNYGPQSSYSYFVGEDNFYEDQNFVRHEQSGLQWACYHLVHYCYWYSVALMTVSLADVLDLDF